MNTTTRAFICSFFILTYHSSTLGFEKPVPITLSIQPQAVAALCGITTFTTGLFCIRDGFKNRNRSNQILANQPNDLESPLNTATEDARVRYKNNSNCSITTGITLCITGLTTACLSASNIFS